MPFPFFGVDGGPTRHVESGPFSVWLFWVAWRKWPLQDLRGSKLCVMEAFGISLGVRNGGMV